MSKKRERTKEMILSAAQELISKQGFEETSMESIAERSEIATGTLYNYFGSKSAVLVALYAKLTKKLHKNVPKRSLEIRTRETAINDLIALLQYFSRSVTLFPKPITRQIYAFMFVLDPSEIGELTSMDMEIMAMLMPIFEDMKQAGLLAKDVDPQAAAMLLYGSSMMQHQAYIMMPDMTQAQLCQAIEAQVRTQFYGLLLRPNQRTKI